MAFVTHLMRGSSVTFPSIPLLWSKEMKLKQYVTTLHMVGRTDRSSLLKCDICLGNRWYMYNKCMHSSTRGSEGKVLRVSAFKGSAKNGDAGERTSSSKVHKNSVKLKGSENTITESPNGNEIPLSYASEADERIAPSPTIHRLFKKWLTILCTQSSIQVGDATLGDVSPANVTSGKENGIQNGKKTGILRAAWFNFLHLDATIKIPFLIFIPLYLAVNAIYGVEVSKELTPLWVMGPFIVALYVKMLQWLFVLYVFSFKQIVKVIRNLPTYYTVACRYMAHGKLKEDIYARFWQPVVNMKNLNYQELSKRKLKELQEWIVEKYIDYVESIWPYYCRTIRFLKRANLI